MKNNLRSLPFGLLPTGYQRTGSSSRFLSALAACGLLVASCLPAKAQFPINESFTGAPASNNNFTTGGGAKLTGTATTPGYLLLTDNTNNQAGYAVLNSSFASPKGFSISFEFFSYNGSGGITTPGPVTGADGISIFLVDASGTDPKITGQFNIGAYGGSLGYAQKTTANNTIPPTTTDVPGVSKGYLGIGLDEFGNFSNPFEGRIGGPGATAQAVALRGPGTGMTGYKYLTGTTTLPFNLSFPASTTEAQPGSADYRKAYIYVVPDTKGGYNITIRIQHGTTITTTTDTYSVSAPPANLRIGFAGSTGGSVNIHEIRNLAILDNPYAVDDIANTTYKAAVPIFVLNNDHGIGAALDPTTIDLDPSTPGIQRTFTVAGQGTFTVASTNDRVIFTPSGTYAGVVTTPYVVSDVTGKVSNPAIITVTVAGADVATNVSGPATASPGAQVTYTVSTTNIGTQIATNVSPTLQLPMGLTIASTASYTYVSSTGLVTFSASTLAANGTVSNSVSFKVPASGTTSITATSGYSYPTGAVVPDPVASNNTATIITNITGVTNTVAVCASPGKDGPVTLTGTSLAPNPAPNTYYPGNSISTVDGISTISVGTAVGATAVVAGDLVLVMQMQGATINTTASGNASSSYGVVSSSTAGQYEYATVASVSGSPISSITLNSALSNPYTNGVNQNFQVIRVPQYSALTVNGTVTSTAWNSATKTGGVMALDVTGITTFSTTIASSLTMAAKGFSGGGGVSYAGPVPAGTTTDNYATIAAGAHGSKGEGIAGTPKNFYDGTSVNTTGMGYTNGDNNRGAPANAGGGAQDFTPGNNTGNSGGGGGANTSAGGIGGFGFGSNTDPKNPDIGTGNQADGGHAFVFAGNVPPLIMGGGGGAGSTNDGTNAARSSGGVGGGIIILRTGKTSGTGSIVANGGNAASPGGAQTLGGGGGGAGGTVLVLATPNPASAATGLVTVSVSATGGNGGNVNNVNGGAAYGPGGGGGGGAVYATSGLSSITVSLGAGGQTNYSKNKGNTNNPTNFGAANGGPGAASNVGNTATLSGAACLPMLSVALSTGTPNVTRTATKPNPATYTATISNTGGAAQNTSTTLTMDPLFTYDNTFTPTVTLTTASGTATTLPASSYTITGTSTLVFSGISIPSGATASIAFRATIATTAVDGTVYQASGTVTFLDPTRTAATNAVGPGDPYAAGGTVPGTNYAAASSTLEDVTIVVPLPVELTRFDVLAIRQNALLMWSTATEHNNDHFTIERSLTGSGFSAVGTVRGQGNSTRTTDYTFTDNGAGRLASATVYYRLKQVDLDGTASYSPVRTVHFATATQATATLYPNPSQGQPVLDLSSLAAGSYSVQVLDLAGRVLRTQQAVAEAAPLDLSGLPQGAYIVLVQGAGTRQALPLLRN